jgi:hypothetical protein
MYSAYHGVNKLVTPYLKILVFSNMRGRERLEEIENHGLGFAEERSHCWCAEE